MVVHDLFQFDTEQLRYEPFILGSCDFFKIIHDLAPMP